MSNLSTLEKIGIIIGVLGFIISTVNVYYTHFYGPDVVIEKFPEGKNIFLSTYDDIEISFILYNKGNKTAFIDNIEFVSYVDIKAPEIYHKYFGYGITPGEINLKPGETQEVKIRLFPSEVHERYHACGQVMVNTTNGNHIPSKLFLFGWGEVPNGDEFKELEKIKENWSK